MNEEGGERGVGSYMVDEQLTGHVIKVELIFERKILYKLKILKQNFNMINYKQNI